MLAIAIASFGLYIFLNSKSDPNYSESLFSGERAYQDIVFQVGLGSRSPGAEGHEQIIDWIEKSLLDNGWQSNIQSLVVDGKTIKNIEGIRENSGDLIIIGAHYDTRLFADNDPIITNRTMPVVGANDGASGVAVLLELARVIPRDIDKNVRLVFFDGEDNGNIEGWDWIMGSRAYVAELIEIPYAAIIVDMVGDSDLNIYIEKSSDEILLQEIWEHANTLNYPEFIPEEKYSMIDDHTPFLQAGIKSVLIIDFDYSYWHTSSDTLDKVNGRSLKIVGDTLLRWLLSP